MTIHLIVGSIFMQDISSIICLILVLSIVFGSRIIRSLLVHQQKMAEIIHRNQTIPAQAPMPEFDAIRQDIETLKTTVNTQTILLDSIVSQQKQLLERTTTGSLSNNN